MRFNSVKGYVLTIGCGLLIAAGVSLILLNLGNDCNLTFYSSIFYGQKIGLVMLIAALCGAAYAWVVKWFVRGIRAIRRGRREGKIDRLAKARKTSATETKENTNENK
jgi:prepilin signal peptidase PulO-like enzyme (type II secretory pathway)